MDTKKRAKTGTYGSPKGAKFQLSESVNWAKVREELTRGGKQAYAIGYLSVAWFKEKISITQITSDDAFRLKDSTRYGFGLQKPVRCAIKNVLYFVDTPGEWFFDTTDNRLYIYPYDGANPTTASLGVWAGPMPIHIDGANNINIERLVIQNIDKGVNGDGGSQRKERNQY